MLIRGPSPFDGCNGHGTHVSGIIAADARNVNASQPFVGVAPGVTIFMYRIFGCQGSTSNDVIIDAMARAFADGVQIISMSLGGLNGWDEGPGAIIASRLADRGVFMSIAAGNDGSDGLFAASSPAAGPDAVAVASVDAGSLVGWQGFTAQNETFVPTLIEGADVLELLLCKSYARWRQFATLHYCQIRS